MRRTLVFCRENAQLGNRLIVYAHLLAAVRERGWALANPTFEPYADWFVGTSSRPHGRRLWPVRLAWQLGKVCAPLSAGIIARARARGQVEVDLQVTLLAAEARAARWLLVQGYRIRCPDWARQQVNGLRQFFTPIDDYRLPAERRVAEMRDRADVVVGIHVRQGDYAQHLAGRYFYSFIQYAGFMRAMIANLAPRRVGFVICSHVPVDHAAFSGLDWVPGPGHPAADLHALSVCDFIVGPPSSFSAWAAFHGETALWQAESGDARCELGAFRRPQYPDFAL